MSEALQDEQPTPASPAEASSSSAGATSSPGAAWPSFREPAPQDPFSKPLAAYLPEAADGEEDDEDLEDDEDGARGAAAPSPRPSPARTSSKHARGPGRPGGGGPKMRQGQMQRLAKLKGRSTDAAAWAEALEAEARKAREALGEDAPASSTSSGPETGAAEASPASSTSSASPEPPTDTILGQPAHRVLAFAPSTLAFWGTVARKCDGTEWEFSGEREMTLFPDSPFERTIKANSERQLAELSAVLLAKHAPKVTDKVDAPETLMAGALLFAFGPQVAQRVAGWVKGLGGWLSRRKGAE